MTRRQLGSNDSVEQRHDQIRQETWPDFQISSDPRHQVNQHRARLVLGWVTVCGQVNHLGM